MGVGAGLYMYVVVIQKFTFAISSPDEFLYKRSPKNSGTIRHSCVTGSRCEFSYEES